MPPTLQDINAEVPPVKDPSLPRRGRPAFSHKDAVWVPSSKYKATVSQVTKDRLFNEAKVDPRYVNKTDDEIRTEIDRGLEVFLRDYPWWYGQLDMDKVKVKRPRTEAQILAFEKLKQASRTPDETHVSLTKTAYP